MKLKEEREDRIKKALLKFEKGSEKRRAQCKELLKDIPQEVIDEILRNNR